MSFKKNKAYEVIPEWSDYYIAYYHLKEEMKNLRNLIPTPQDRIQGVTQVLPEEEFKTLEKDFQKTKYDSSLQKFMDIFVSKVDKIVEFFDNLLDELDKDVNILENTKGELDNTLEFSDKDMISKYHTNHIPKRVLIIIEIFEILTDVDSFIVINLISLQQLKDKFFKLHPKHKFNIGINDFFDKEENKLQDIRKRIGEINDKQAENLSKSYGIPYKEAILYLSNFKRKKVKSRKIITFVIFNIIMITLFLIFYYVPLSSLISLDDYIFTYFGSFIFTFSVLFLTLGIFTALYIASKYRLNYLFMFKLDPKKTASPAQMIMNTLSLFIIWWIIFIANKLIITFYGVELQDVYYIFSLLNFLIFILILLFPFRTLYFRYRKQLLIELVQMFYPIGKDGVSFKKYIITDILTSFTKPMGVILLWFCLLNCQECRDKTLNLDCSKKNYFILGVQVLPSLIRFAQCINKYYYTRKKWPHLVNAMKFLVAVTANTINNLFQMKHVSDLTYIFINIVYSIYSGLWDLKLDFGLLNFDSQNLLLRNSLTYPKMFYYWAMISNTLLRFTWTLWRVPFIGSNLGVFILICLEIFRRSQWLVLRLEVEEIQNPEAYREYLIIPKLPLNF